MQAYQVMRQERPTQHRHAGSVVVGVDGSPASDAAVEWAARQAGLKNAGVLLVQVRPEPLDGLEGDGDRPPGQVMPVRLTRAIAKRFGVVVAGMVSQGDVVGTLAGAAEGAQLLVLGQPDPTSAEGLASRCAQVVSCPVVSVPTGTTTSSEAPPGPGPERSVVVGLDSSRESWAALNWGITEARVRRCACEVLHLPDEKAHAGTDVRARRVALALVERAVEYAASCGVEAHGKLVGGSPGRALLDATVGADLLVLGGGPREESDPLGHERLAALCIRATTCPVVLVTPHRLALG